MALMDSYLIKTIHMTELFSSIQSAQAPDRFTLKFLENMGFSSSNDRLFIRVLKSLNLIDENGAPTENYYEFLDQSAAPRLMAKLLRVAYGDLFAINKKANEMSEAELKNKLKTLTQGKKSESVISNMVRTFKALSEFADWDPVHKPQPQIVKTKEKSKSEEVKEEPLQPQKAASEEPVVVNRPNRSQLHYNIQIHLPESRDPKVYDAIFESLNKHLV
jgi:hypothetical protein